MRAEPEDSRVLSRAAQLVNEVVNFHRKGRSGRAKKNP